MKHSKVISLRATKLAFALGIATALSACGGGGGGSSEKLDLSGTAAVGQTVAGGTVTVKCSVGTGTATTTSTGSYTVSITDGEGPCLVTVTKGDLILRSISTGLAGGVVNVTPLTNAFVAYVETLTGAANFDALLTDPEAKALLSSPAQVQRRIEEDFVPFVKSTLGVDISVTNFLTATITPPSGTTPGSDADNDLVAFGAVVDTGTGQLKPEVQEKVKEKAHTDAHEDPVSTTGAGR